MPVVTCVRDALLADGYELTECRLLDIYLWAYSGQYDPLWRRIPSVPVAPTVAAAPPFADAAAPAGVELFRDAEQEYMAWIAGNPRGWVVNTSRTPTAGYLMLHRADCWSVGLQGVGNYTTRGYIKVCSLDRAALDTWAPSSVGGVLTLCGFCEARVARDAGSSSGTGP